MPPLRSGNGRHRRPRQAPALLVTAGVTGASIAIPLLGATGAQAADGHTWDRVAECESGGVWSADDGSGYYGGLGLSVRTWKEFGGTAYAERPDLASRDEQITVAERVLAERGPLGWPKCGARSGLTGGGSLLERDGEWSASAGPVAGDAEEDGHAQHGGAAPSPGPGASDEPSSTPSDDPSATPSGDASHDGARGGAPGAAATPHDSGPSSGTRAGDAAHPGRAGDGADHGRGGPGTGSGRHRGTVAEHPSRGTADAAGRDRGRGRDRGEHAGEHRVAPGESLSLIAAEHDVRGGWPELYAHNRDVVGSDPDLILPGQRLRL